LICKTKLAAEKQRETHISSNEENARWIQDYVERETSAGRKRVKDADAAVQQSQDDMTHAEIAGLMARKSEKMFREMLAATRDSLSDLAMSDNGEDGEDEDDEEPGQGKLSEDDKPGRVIGHNHQNGTAAHDEVKAEADEAQRIDSTGMGGCSQLFP
jgi:hypothetical protein